MWVVQMTVLSLLHIRHDLLVGLLALFWVMLNSANSEISSDDMTITMASDILHLCSSSVYPYIR